MHHLLSNVSSRLQHQEAAMKIRRKAVDNQIDKDLELFSKFIFQKYLDATVKDMMVDIEKERVKGNYVWPSVGIK